MNSTAPAPETERIEQIAKRFIDSALWWGDVYRADLQRRNGPTQEETSNLLCKRLAAAITSDLSIHCSSRHAPERLISAIEAATAKVLDTFRPRPDNNITHDNSYSAMIAAGDGSHRNHRYGGEIMRVLVCGGRAFDDRDYVYRALDRVWQECPPDTMMVIQGGATGADALARDWCIMRRVDCINVPANWDAYGKQAGPLRNEKMLRRYKAQLVIAFPGGKGTADMMKRAKDAGVTIQNMGAPDDLPLASGQREIT